MFEKLSFILTHILCLVYGTIQPGCDNIMRPFPFTSMQSFNEIRCPPEGGVASDVCRRQSVSVHFAKLKKKKSTLSVRWWM